MMSTTSRRSLLLSVAAGTAMASAAQAQRPQSLEVSDLTIETDGGKHRFKVEVARTAEQRALGLMHRRSMPADAGMLFDFETDQPVAMWMMNTLIPLDMLFIARDGRIVNIAQRTVPHSTASIPSAGSVRFVLELNGGATARLGIKAGDRAIHPIFRNAN